MKRIVATAAFLFAFVSAAGAATVTYDIADFFGGHINPGANGNSNPQLPHAELIGSLTFDTELSGIDALVDYSLSSRLPNAFGGTSRTSTYTFGGSGERVNYGSGGHFNLFGASNSVLSLVIDELTIGDAVLAFSASEKFLNCKTVFSGGYPRNSCSLPNYGIGLGTGTQGSNTSAAMTGSSSAVPLPATAPLLAGALFGFGWIARRRAGKA